jgi:hypothetical protein
LPEIRFPLLYRAREKDRPTRVGFGVAHVREVPAPDAPVVLRQRMRWEGDSGSAPAKVQVDYRWHDGDLWEPAFKDAPVLPCLAGLPSSRPGHLDVSPGQLRHRARGNPLLPFWIHYGGLVGLDSNLPRDRIDDVEMSERLLASEVWGLVLREAEAHVVIDGVFHRRSPGPVMFAHMGPGTAHTGWRLPWTYTPMPSASWFTVHQAGEMARLLEDRQIKPSREGDYQTVGIGSLDEIDTGYDPLPLAVEQTAWERLADVNRNALHYLGPEARSAIVALRRGLEALHGRELDFSPRHALAANPRGPLDKAGAESFALLPLIHRVVETGWINGGNRERLDALAERVEGRLAGYGHDDDAALSAVFP